MDTEIIEQPQHTFGLPSVPRKYAKGKLSRDYNKDLISVGRGKGGEKNYLQVKHRLEMLREQFPEATVDSECIDISETHARFKVVVSLPNGGRGTGHGSETKADFPDFFEKAETKALGRALNAAGIGVQFGGDFEYEADSPKSFKGVDAPITPKVQMLDVPPDILAITDRDELIKRVQEEQERIGVKPIVEYMKGTGKK